MIGVRCQLALIRDTQHEPRAHQLQQERTARAVARVLAQRAVSGVPLIEAHAAPPAAHRVRVLHAVEAGTHELIVSCRRVWT